MKKVNLTEKLEQINDYWNPRSAAEFNSQQVRLAKVQGEFVFHNHDDTDEMFYVVKGKLKIDLKDRIEEINEGEFFIVPKGFIHKPIADEEVHLMILTGNENINTGDIKNDFTIDKSDMQKI